MRVLTDSGAVKKNQIKAIGVPRYDNIFNYSKKLTTKKNSCLLFPKNGCRFFDSLENPPEKYKNIFRKIPKQKLISKKFNNILDNNEKKMISILADFAKKIKIMML